MKRILFALLMFVGVSTVIWAQPIPATKFIKMSEEKYNIGKVGLNKPTVFYMEFANIGKKPVIVENVMAGCGCTVPEKPQAPIMPGKTGKVKIAYSGTSKGKFTKDVTIKIKGADPMIIYFIGEVV